MNETSGLSSGFVMHASNQPLGRAWVLFLYFQLFQVYGCEIIISI